MSTVYLVDKSAWEWARRDPVARADFTHIVGEGITATCHVATMEVLYSARSPEEYERLRFRWASLAQLPDPSAGTYEADMAWVMDRAMEVQRLLTETGEWRRPVTDLMIAACAERAGATVLHVDKDYSLIAQVTGQPERRLATSM
ncbi:PIN domain-containing protein [Nonomuraea typhae]|uniref:PIN domain-containing protein n=1 Tax=Nonomuraea typhae TaxID=2603600 RepID=UPI0015E220F4|nr:PIN domain-containing protein [Nonomuraea typhae]